MLSFNSYTIKALLPLVIPISLLAAMGVVENINQPGKGIIHFLQVLPIISIIIIILRSPQQGGLLLLILTTIATAVVFSSQTYSIMQIIFIDIVFLLPAMITGVLLTLPSHINLQKKMRPYHNQKNV